MMLPKMRHSTGADARTLPIATTDPTLQCVVLIGMPMLDARRTVAAAPISIVKPLQNKKREDQERGKYKISDNILYKGAIQNFPAIFRFSKPIIHLDGCFVNYAVQAVTCIYDTGIIPNVLNLTR